MENTPKAQTITDITHRGSVYPTGGNDDLHEPWESYFVSWSDGASSRVLVALGGGDGAIVENRGLDPTALVREFALDAIRRLADAGELAAGPSTVRLGLSDIGL